MRLLIAGFLALSAYAQDTALYGPETCREGYVWREACGPNDHVCVSDAVRAQAQSDNSQAASRRQGSGPFGPDTCRPGYVWREACGPQDHVCVTPAVRQQAVQDNAQAGQRFFHTPMLSDVVTQHNDSARTGAQLRETTLTPANVTPTTFGRLYERYVDGQVITQPLYVNAQWIPGKGLRNVAYVATRRNWVYAFDADSTDPDPTHGLIWPAAVHIENDGPVPGMCAETQGSVGITSTPVIDRASDTMYLVARKSDGTVWLHALDIATGQPKAGTPGSFQVTASVPGPNGGTILFQKALELNRAALLLSNGAIFLAFSALNCDNAGWHGWVLAYRAPDLAPVGVFVTTQAADGGGVWQSGNGLVADGTGNIYFNTGNSQLNNSTDMGESVIKLHVGAAPAYGLTFGGKYTVSNWAALDGGDTDLASGGPVLLPGNRLISGGKQGKVYILDPATMAPTQNPPAPGPVPPGGSDGFQGFINTWHDDASELECTYAWIPGRKCHMTRTRYENSEANGPNIHGGPVFWPGANPAYGLIYGMPEKDYLRAFRYDNATHQVASPASTVSPVRSPDGMPGSPLSLSANGSTGGIVWAMVPKFDGQWENVPGRLVAFDALSLNQIWSDEDNIGYSKFTPATVAGGKVFRPTFANKLVVYGLTAHPPGTPCYNIAQKYQNYTEDEGPLGAATSAELVAPDGVGHFRHYALGSIYWTPTTCAHAVRRQIYDKWAATSWERGPLGYPITDETGTPDGIGHYNHFQNGSIYWTPLTGAFEVHGAIRDRWSSLGWERSALGYPISDETDEVDGSGRFNIFEHGTIHWKRTTGAITVNSNPAILMGPGHAGFERAGGDIDNLPLPAATPAMCQQKCADNAACRAWTYVNPGVQGPQAHCWLKGSMPLEAANACCTSGIKVDMHPASIVSVQGATDRVGSDYANFDLPTAVWGPLNFHSSDFRLCQGECAASGVCRAFSYAPTPNGCCVAGSK